MRHFSLVALVAVSVAISGTAAWGAVPGQYTSACSDCHGMPPVDAAYRNISTGGFRGNHETHAGDSPGTCVRCHDGSASFSSSHMDAVVTLSANLNSSSLAATYRVDDQPIPFVNRTSGWRPGTCSSVNCHFESVTPLWGGARFSSANDCAACHAVPGPSSSHTRHDLYYSWADNGCSSCHPDYKTGLQFSHATSAGNRGIRVALPEGEYSGDGAAWLPSQHEARTFGSCTNLYCHSNGEPFDTAASFKSVTWGSSLTCTACHDGGGDATALSGRHGKHTGGIYEYACERCHRTTVTDSDTISDRSLHVNREKDISFTEGGSYNDETRACSSNYCHSDGRGGAPYRIPNWSDTAPMGCYSCHGGRAVDNTIANCTAKGGTWDAGRGLCTPFINITTNGHNRLVNPQWIRKYPCHFCHDGTVDSSGSVKNPAIHVNGTKDVAMAGQWAIVGRPAPSYVIATKTCDNVYCHSDGTSEPEAVRPFAWTDRKAECNACHGHPTGSCNSAGCHDGRIDGLGKVWTVKTGWPAGREWLGSTPMYPNQGAGTARANSHARHTQTNFSCDQCHAATITNGDCMVCHADGIPAGSMSEVAHSNGTYHVNKVKDVVFKSGGSYNSLTKTCTNTACHTGGSDPVWGGSVNSSVTCLTCHGTTGGDKDSYRFQLYSSGAKINTTEWVTTGHGRPAASGAYPGSGNPAANFPGNPCWYCHDNESLHNDETNFFRLRKHLQFENRFEKECVYCHMEGTDVECLACHNSLESLAPQLAALPADPSTTWPDGISAPRPDHTLMTDGLTSCTTVACHFVDPANSASDMKRHNEGAGNWTIDQKADIKNQYVMMGVCLKCHDDDTDNKCIQCHTPPPGNPLKFAVGFDPGTGFIKPQKALATSAHFGYKHWRSYQKDGVWKGGKFCWDCHDPHGDSNIYMVHSKVATSTEGVFGIPMTQANVVFTRKQNGLDYAKTSAPYNGICNVCHSSSSKHFTATSGDGHNAGKVCTVCHEHRFSDSHAGKQSCNACHANKPVPRHAAFGLPRDCIKCHTGTIAMRMDIAGQFKGTSHHVQGVELTNMHCYACHWEADANGLIDNRYHEGYNYKTYTTVKNAKVDLVLWKPEERPAFYNTTTAVTFLANSIGTGSERAEVAKVSNHCLSCHNDANSNITPFDDCKTPDQYAWDGLSIAARYSQTGTTLWGKYNSTTYPNANQKDKVTKSFSAHGNAIANQGGYNSSNGIDSAIPNTRGGTANVQCFDCHSSHGSKLVGVTSSYVTFNGTRNGGNLKETQAGKGGYLMTYKASSNSAPGAVNPYNAGAGQCFDCHFTATAGTTPWGYQSTFGATVAIKGYKDSTAFAGSDAAKQSRFGFRAGMQTMGGHLKGSSFLNSTTAAHNKINGLCTPCHDPHGVTPTLGTKQAYGIPLLKGTWMTSPYREDIPQASTTDPPGGSPNPTTTPTVFTDQNTFGGERITEDDTTFAGLCLQCHSKSRLSNGTNHTWNSKDRIHESVKGWKTANGTIQHSYTCSKCHTPHSSTLPRLMMTNCLDYRHRGKVVSGGQAGSNSGRFTYYYGDAQERSGSFPKGLQKQGVNCHPGGAWPNNYWNTKTPW